MPVDTVQQVLTKANQAGIVALNQDQVGAAINAFKAFSSKTQLSLTTPGAVSSFGGLLSTTIKDPAQQSAFTNLYLTQPIASDFWSQAAALKIPAQTLDVLKLQGKLLYLTFNSAPLAQQLQKDIGSVSNISQIVNRDYYRPDAWQNTLTALAGTGGDQALAALIPTIYPGQTTSDRLTAYSADLARKVRLSFPTESTARMIDNQELALPGNTGGNVSTFLKAAAPLGFKLGRTPLNAFLNKLPAGVPALDVASTASLKTLHRLYQITPSSESLQAAVKLGFTSARDIASYSRDQFLGKYSIYFPPGEGEIVFGQAQTVSSVTFNFFALAKQLDTTAPAYAISASGSDFQKAKNAIVQQFPTMASLFGNLDFCQCDDCRSVLSPAAYFVDVLEFLNKSGANSKGYTPLDVLIGKDTVVPGRRPDLAALPLSCENTNTAMPYIDLVNEILEYYIANSHLDASAAYDTGTATTAELTAEPQHILPLVYNKPLKQAVYPLNLPFDLWIETVRGFLNYFKEPLAQVLLVLRSRRYSGTLYRRQQPASSLLSCAGFVGVVGFLARPVRSSHRHRPGHAQAVRDELVPAVRLPRRSHRFGRVEIGPDSFAAIGSEVSGLHRSGHHRLSESLPLLSRFSVSAFWHRNERRLQLYRSAGLSAAYCGAEGRLRGAA